MQLLPFTNSEIQKYHNKLKFNGVYLGNNLPIKNRAYVKYLDMYESIGTHGETVHVNGDNVTYFDRFGVKTF